MTETYDALKTYSAQLDVKGHWLTEETFREFMSLVDKDSSTKNKKNDSFVDRFINSNEKSNAKNNISMNQLLDKMNKSTLEMITKMQGIMAHALNEINDTMNSDLSKSVKANNYSAIMSNFHKAIEASKADFGKKENLKESVAAQQLTQLFPQYMDKINQLYQGFSSSFGDLSRIMSRVDNQRDVTPQKNDFSSISSAFKTMVINPIFDSINVLNNLRDKGLGFGITLDKALSLGTQTLGISVTDFTNLAKNNAETIIRMGSGGLELFTNVLKETRTKVQGQFYGLGMSIDQINEYTSDYLDIQKVQGNLSSKSINDQTTSASKYIKQLDQLSQVTGKSREQISKELKDIVSSADVTTAIRLLPESIQQQVSDQFGGFATMLGSVSKTGEQVFKELFTTNGLYTHDLSQKLLTIDPALAKIIEHSALMARDGKLTHEEQVSAMNEMRNIISKSPNAVSNLALLGDGVGAAAQVVMEFRANMLKWSESQLVASDRQNKAAEDAQAASNAITALGNTFQNAVSTFVLKLGGGDLEKGIAVINSAIADFSTHLNNNLINEMDSFFKAISNIAKSVNWLAEKIAHPFSSTKEVLSAEDQRKKNEKAKDDFVDSLFQEPPKVLSAEDERKKNEKAKDDFVDSLFQEPPKVLSDFEQFRKDNIIENTNSELFDFSKLKQWGDSIVDKIKPMPKLETVKNNANTQEPKINVDVKTDNKEVVESLSQTNSLLQKLSDQFSNKQDSEKFITPTSH
jgi:hypothetical protein